MSKFKRGDYIVCVNYFGTQMRNLRISKKTTCVVENVAEHAYTLELPISVNIKQMITVDSDIVDREFELGKRPDPSKATILINGDTDDQEFGSEGLDELAATIAITAESNEHAPGIFIRGRSGKLYSIFKIMQKCTSIILNDHNDHE